MRSPSHDVSVQKDAVDWLGNIGEQSKQKRSLGHMETWDPLAYRHPPVELALYNCGSRTVVSEGWNARPCDPAATAGLGHVPHCVLAQWYPPPGFTPAPR